MGSLINNSLHISAESELKIFWKSVNICRSYGQLSRGSFFYETRCTVHIRWKYRWAYQHYYKREHTRWAVHHAADPRGGPQGTRSFVTPLCMLVVFDLYESLHMMWSVANLLFQYSVSNGRYITYFLSHWCCLFSSSHSEQLKALKLKM